MDGLSLSLYEWSMRLKILSYNIHKGFDWNNKNYILSEIKELIDSSHADLVLLQEVVGQNTTWNDRGYIDSQIEYLADRIWPHFSYARNAVYDHGHHGNLILSKYPIEKYHNLNISTNLWEKRGMLVASIQLPTGITFHVACLHLNLLHSGRKLQYQLIEKYLRSKPMLHSPFVLAGDFNDWNQKSSLSLENVMGMKEAHKATHGRYARTFPAAYPMLCLDRIYVKNVKIVRSAIFHFSHQYTRHLSDHLPLYCEVEIHET